jgi:hypothetical protein
MQRDRVLHNLAAIRREIHHLSDLERSWRDGPLSADDRIGYRAEWENSLDRFAAVAAAYARGQVDHDIADQAIDVAKALVSFTPSLDRMQLRRPSADDLRLLGVLSAV